MHHIVSDCRNRRFTGILNDLYAATDEVVLWLDRLDVDINDERNKLINK